MTDASVDPAIEAGGEVLENEICRLTKSLATLPAPSSGVARLGRKAARRALDSWPLATALLGTLAVLTFFNLSGNGLASYDPPQLPVAEQQQRLETTARFAAIEAQAFLRDHGRLPHSPIEAGLSANDDVSFVAVGGGDFVVVVRAGQLEARSSSRIATRSSGG